MKDYNYLLTHLLEKRIMKKILILTMWLICGLTYISCSDEPIASLPNPNPSSDDLTPPVVTELPRLHVDGRYLKNEQGEIVNLHGSWQTNNPYFNTSAWSNYDVDACLRYNRKVLDGTLAAGWKLDFIRLHMDQYWSDDPSITSDFTYEKFDEARFRKYLDLVYVPMAEYIQSRGLYVVLLAGISCPQNIEVGDGTNQLLLKYWDIVSQHPKIKNNPNIMFELINEPVNILGTDGTYGSNNQGHFDKLKEFFQPVVNKIRENTDSNIIWVSGLAYEANFSGFANNPIEGKNIGYSVHLYPGWMNSDGENGDGGIGDGGGYEPFQQGWDNQVKPVADFAPILITEMDWAPSKYNSSWGKSITGTVGGKGFGANFKYITDNSGNVSWLFFAGIEHLPNFVDIPGEEGNYTFLNDPEACVWPCYHWFQEYANGGANKGELTGLSIENVDTNKALTVLTGGTKSLIVKATYADGTTDFVTTKVTYTSSNYESIVVDGKGRLISIKDGESDITISYTDTHGTKKELQIHVVSSTFPLTNDVFNPSIAGEGTFDEDTKVLITGQWGYGGWYYNNGIDISEYNYLVVKLAQQQSCGAQFNIRDENNAYAKAAEYKFENSQQVVIDIHNMYNTEGVKLNPSHIFYAGFWTHGGTPLYIDQVYMTNDNPYGELTNLEVKGLGATKDANRIAVGYSVPFKLIATYKKSGVISTKDVTKEAKCTSSNSSAINVEKGTIKANGAVENATITFQYETKKLEIGVSSQNLDGTNPFPLILGALNPNMKGDDGDGTFDVANKILRTSHYGTGGWHFPNGLDLSGYKYLVVELEQDPGTWMNFNIRDINDPNIGAAEYKYDTGLKKIVVDLNNMKRVNSETSVSSSHIYYVGFWNLGVDNPIYIKNISVTNTPPYSALTKLEVQGLSVSKEANNMAVGYSVPFHLQATFADNTTTDVTFKAECTNSNSSVVKVENGSITALSTGEATLTFSYEFQGKTERTTISVSAKTIDKSDYFPLVLGAFNPNLSGGKDGTFSVDTKTFKPSQWGIGGWHFPSGLDLSSYKYLIVDLNSVPGGDMNFNIRDENNIWAGAAEYKPNGSTRIVVDLNNMKRVNSETPVSSSHIYYVGFWNYGPDTPVVIDRIYPMNDLPE
ncbi:cellulase family glycosylhydrolase [Bacteroides thetaiotaomicron]|nr:cellulase family glycosylhydrolase [Bacteroides thetaiotaomicron]